MTAVPAYAQALGIAPALQLGQLQALLLSCGPYVMRSSDATRVARWLMHKVLWASWRGGGEDATTFVSRGNADRRGSLRGRSLSPVTPTAQRILMSLHMGGIPECPSS